MPSSVLLHITDSAGDTGHEKHTCKSLTATVCKPVMKTAHCFGDEYMQGGQTDSQSAVCWWSMTFSDSTFLYTGSSTDHTTPPQLLLKMIMSQQHVLAQKSWFLSALQQELVWSVYFDAPKMEIRRFIKLPLDLSAVRLHMFAALSSTRPKNPNNPWKLKFSQRLAAIGTTNAKLITDTFSYVTPERFVMSPQMGC